jgi:hypothetical protein
MHTFCLSIMCHNHFIYLFFFFLNLSSSNNLFFIDNSKNKLYTNKNIYICNLCFQTNAFYAEYKLKYFKKKLFFPRILFIQLP